MINGFNGASFEKEFRELLKKYEVGINSVNIDSCGNATVEFMILEGNDLYSRVYVHGTDTKITKIEI